MVEVGFVAGRSIGCWWNLVNSDDGATLAFLWRRRHKRKKPRISASRAIPPTTPPAIAPTLDLDLEEDAAGVRVALELAETTVVVTVPVNGGATPLKVDAALRPSEGLGPDKLVDVTPDDAMGVP